MLWHTYQRFFSCKHELVRRSTRAALMVLLVVVECCSWTVFPALLVAQEWEQVQIPPPPDGFADYWLEVFFLPSNPRYGWIVGMNRHIIRTTDGGRTWTRSSAPGRVAQLAPGFSSADFLEGVMFADSLVGYVSGPAGVFKSTDGGATWRTVGDSTMNNVWGIWVASRDTVMVGVGGCELLVIDSMTVESGAQRFYRTTDGGTTWSVFRGREPFSSLADITLLSSRGLGYASSSGRIWRTLDGGVTWDIFARTRNAQSLSDRPWQEEISVVGNTFLVPTAGGNCETRDIQTGSARMSTDGGATWREIITGVNMFGCFLLNESTGWACGDNARVIRTADGGRTWELRNCGIPDDVNIDDMWFVNDTTAWAVGGKFDNGSNTRTVYRYVPPSRRQYRLAPARTTLCEGETLTLNAPQGFISPVWSTGDTTRSITVRRSGRYSVRGCEQFSDTVSIEFIPAPEATIAVRPANRGCEGDTLVLEALNVRPGFRYAWSLGDSLLAVSTRLPVARTSGVARYQLTVTHTNGCQTVSTASVQIVPRPNVIATALRSTTFCLQDSTVLSAPAGFEAYQWFRRTPNSFVPLGRSPQLVVTQSGDYSVQVTDASGCRWFSQEIEVTAYNFAKYLFIISPLRNGVFSIDSTVYGDRRCVQLLVENRDSLRAVEVSSAFMARNVDFSLPLAQFPVVFPPRSVRPIQICFAPSRLAAQRDTLIVADSCGTTPVPLVSVGVPREATQLTRCSTNVILQFSGSPRTPFLRASQPMPNPSSEEVLVVVEKVYPAAAATNASHAEPLAHELRWALYNVVGNVVAEGHTEPLGEYEEHGLRVEQVQVRTSVRHLERGMYILRLRTTGGIATLSVAVGR